MSLLVELLTATLLIIIVIVIHGTGVAFMDKLFQYEARALRQEKLASREIKVMVPMALCLFGLHVAKILVFALFYWFAGDVHGFRALYTTRPWPIRRWASSKARSAGGRWSRPSKAWPGSC